jgi:hypothetical protein
VIHCAPRTSVVAIDSTKFTCGTRDVLVFSLTVKWMHLWLVYYIFLIVLNNLMISSSVSWRNARDICWYMGKYMGGIRYIPNFVEWNVVARWVQSSWTVCQVGLTIWNKRCSTSPEIWCRYHHYHRRRSPNVSVYCTCVIHVYGWTSFIVFHVNFGSDEWPASRPGCFTPEERAPGTHWIGGWVGPRSGLEKRNFLTVPRLELRPPRSSSL